MNKQVVAILLFTCQLIIWQAQQPAASQIKSTYDWTIQIETKELNNYYPAKDTNLRDFVLCNITLCPASGSPKNYEQLFYASDRCIGARRINPLALKHGDEVAIRLKRPEGPPSPSQTSAAANAVVRCLLDAFAAGGIATTILTPPEAYLNTIQGMAREKFFIAPPATPDEPRYSKISVHIYSEPEGQQDELIYQ